MHYCRCCGDAVNTSYSEQPLCSACIADGCDPDPCCDDCKIRCACGDPESAEFLVTITYTDECGEPGQREGYACSEHLAGCAEAMLPADAVLSDDPLIQDTWELRWPPEKRQRVFGFE